MDRDINEDSRKKIQEQDRGQVETGSMGKPSAEMRPELLQKCPSMGSVRAGAGGLGVQEVSSGEGRPE